MGKWEGAYVREIDETLKEFRMKGLQLQTNGISVKIFPRFKSFMVDWIASDQSKSAVFWHGEKDTHVLHKHWKIQDNNTIFPKCDLRGDEHTSTGRTELSTTWLTEVSSTGSTTVLSSTTIRRLYNLT